MIDKHTFLNQNVFLVDLNSFFILYSFGEQGFEWLKICICKDMIDIDTNQGYILWHAILCRKKKYCRLLLKLGASTKYLSSYQVRWLIENKLIKDKK